MSAKQTLDIARIYAAMSWAAKYMTPDIIESVEVHIYENKNWKFQAERDVDFILRACNSHNAFLEAAKEAVKQMEQRGIGFNETGLRDAIAQAEEVVRL
jgi:hypothetical protein